MRISGGSRVARLTENWTGEVGEDCSTLPPRVREEDHRSG